MKVASYIDKYIWVLNVILLVFLAWAAAKTTSTAVRAHHSQPDKVRAWIPPRPEETSGDEGFPTSVELIEERNIFNAKVEEESAGEKGEAQQTVRQGPLNLELLGVAIGPGWAFATINDKKTREKYVVSIGEEVEPEVRVASIEPDRVVFERADGALEEIFLVFSQKRTVTRSTQRPQQKRYLDGFPTDEGGGDYGKMVKAVSDTEYVIDREGFQAAMSNINEIVTQARMVPNFTPDRQVNGFRIFRVKPRSVFRELGLRNGDVIQEVNGIKLDDPTKGLELFQTLRDQSNFTINLKRGNQKMTFTYTVK